MEGYISDLQTPIEPGFGSCLPTDQVELLLVVLSSLPKEVFEKGLDTIEDAFESQKDRALIDRNAGKN